MKLAIFYPRNSLAGWYAVGGYAAALRRMGHEVLDWPLPGNIVRNVENEPRPTSEELNRCDAIVSFYHEYTQPWLAAFYGYELWSKLKPPVIARFDESMDRGDLGLPNRMPELLKWAKHVSFPAVQDAKKYSGQWLPYGADTTMFKPPEKPDKRYGAGFIGSLYPQRARYLNGLAEQINNSVVFHCGQVGVSELAGWREPESTELLALEYQRLKVFFCLPPMSRLIVAKVFDVMASGTFVMFPRLQGEGSDNLSIFENERHLIYYQPGYVRENAKQIQRWLKDETERESIARAGCELVRSTYTLDKMLENLLSLVGAEAAA